MHPDRPLIGIRAHLVCVQNEKPTPRWNIGSREQLLTKFDQVSTNLWPTATEHDRHLADAGQSLAELDQISSMLAQVFLNLGIVGQSLTQFKFSSSWANIDKVWSKPANT